MRKEIENRVKRAIEEKVFPGCVIGTIRTNGSREILPFGRFAYDADGQGVTEDTIYDLASITKSIPTASLVLQLMDEGKLKTSDKLITYIPEFASRWRDKVTLEHLLAYRIHGLQLSSLKDKTADEILVSAYSHELADKPGEKSYYTNLPALLLGIVLERVGGKSLDALAREHFFIPLNMMRTSFFPSQKKDEIAPTEIVEGLEVRGVVHDESARVFAKAGLAVGHAGLFSTAPDILNFLESLLQGKYPKIVEGAQKDLGWQLNQSWFMGTKCGPLTFGKTGFTGTSVVADIDRGVGFVILSNRTYPQRPPDAASIHSAINPFRADIADIVFR